MYAIMEFKGYQYRIEKDMVLKVPYLAETELGGEIKIDKILMMNSDNKVTLGSPIINSAFATAEILKHGRDHKIIVFKKKRRKGYRKTQGHRQNYTEIKIKDISL